MCERCVQEGCLACRRDEPTDPPAFIQFINWDLEKLIGPFWVTDILKGPMDGDNDPRAMGIFRLPMKLPADGAFCSSAQL